MTSTSSDLTPPPKPGASAGLDKSSARDQDIPLLYGNLGTEADATPLVTPSEEEMARHLAAQMAAVEAERLAAAPDPISAERTAQFAALDEATRISGLPRDFDETTLMLVHTEIRPTVPASHGVQHLDDINSELAAVRAQSDAAAQTASTKAQAGKANRSSIAVPAYNSDGADKPRQVGPYQVHKRLGKGGMGTVYRAYDPLLRRDVAVKFMHASMCEDSDARERFLREARAAGALSHPNIVAVHDVGEIENRPYMAMELVQGTPLAAVLEQRRQLPIRDTVLLGVQLASALEFAHSHGIVHRDIKPGNIMLLDDGRTLKVGDFGIADISEPLGERRASGSVTGPVLGTPQYMSPEHTRGEVVDGRSDLFSAGVVLYQMLAGERPFRAENLVALATRIATEEPPPLLRKRPDVPASLRRVVERCLAKAPAQRWQTGQELADALLRVLAELDEAQAQNLRKRPISLAWKWAAAMALASAMVTGLAAFWAAHQMQAALMASAGQHGAEWSQALAAQYATQVLAEEWESLAPQLAAAVQAGPVRSLALADSAGIVRASSVQSQVGQAVQATGEALAGLNNGTTQGRRMADGLLGFQTAVALQGKTVGTVWLTLPQTPWAELSASAARLLAVLAVLTTLVITLAGYVYASVLNRSLRQLTEAMGELARGRMDFRISQTRNDELGQAFASFDAMAQALERQSSAPGHGTDGARDNAKGTAMGKGPGQ